MNSEGVVLEEVFRQSFDHCPGQAVGDDNRKYGETIVGRGIVAWLYQFGGNNSLYVDITPTD